MNSRPYFNRSTAEIEKLYKDNINDIGMLSKLLSELHHRDKPKAIQLREEITSVLSKIAHPNGTDAISTPKPKINQATTSAKQTISHAKVTEGQSKSPSSATPDKAEQALLFKDETPQNNHVRIEIPQPKPDLCENQIRVIRVIEYLSSLARFNSSVVRDLTNYQNVLWFADIPRNGTNCYSRTWGADENSSDDVWLEVKKMQEPPLPIIPKICEGWVDESLLRKFDSAPSLRQTIVLSKKHIDPVTREEREDIETRSLSDYPSIMTTWDGYIDQKWNPWTTLYKQYSEIQKVFGSLFGVYQEQQRLGEQYELVIGLGLLTWRQSKGQPVRRHLLIAKVSLEFEPAIGRFAVRAAPDGDQAEVELDMLEPECFPANAQTLVRAGRQLRDNFWDRTISNAILASISNSLEGQGRGLFQADVERASGASATDVPLIEYAPALILRKRSQKGLLDILAKMLGQVELGVEIPEQFRDLCEVSDQYQATSETKLQGASTPDHIYFTLPANEQQRQIIYKYNQQNGVLVQGPPGTGKSQTISNLICHLLATGQRILVTAKTARALEVLHEKIPQAVSPLCISMLGSGTEERESLERSVNSILTNINTRNEITTTRKMEEYEQQLDSNKRKRAEALYALVAIREKETFEHSICEDEYTGTAAAIAIQLYADAKLYEWFEDEISENEEFPLTRLELDMLSTLLLDVSDDMEVELCKYVPDTTNDIPDCEKMRKAWRKLTIYEQNKRDKESIDCPLSCNAITCASNVDVVDLRDATTRLVSEIQSVMRRPLSWVKEATNEVLADLDTPWTQLHKLTVERLDVLKKLAHETQSLNVEIPENIDLMRLSGDAKTLLDHLSLGGGLKKIIDF